MNETIEGEAGGDGGRSAGQQIFLIKHFLLRLSGKIGKENRRRRKRRRRRRRRRRRKRRRRKRRRRQRRRRRKKRKRQMGKAE